MSMSDLQHEPRWYRWLIYAIAAGFVGLFIPGVPGLFFGSVKPQLKDDVVAVKDAGLVDLEPMLCKWTPESSFVERLCFDVDADYAVVKLKGVYYQFCGIPPSETVAWVESASVGRFFNDRVKGRYNCR